MIWAVSFLIFISGAILGVWVFTLAKWTAPWARKGRKRARAIPRGTEPAKKGQRAKKAKPEPPAAGPRLPLEEPNV